MRMGGDDVADERRGRLALRLGPECPADTDLRCGRRQAEDHPGEHRDAREEERPTYLSLLRGDALTRRRAEGCVGEVDDEHDRHEEKLYRAGHYHPEPKAG